ncbi:MAG: type I pantothenate kinase [Acidimicrobiales bacterium]
MTELVDGPPAGPAPAPGYVTFTREQWATLGRATPARGPDRDGDGDAGVDWEADGPVSPGEPVQIYLPLCRLLSAVASAGRARARRVAEFLDVSDGHQPFVIGLAGSVAVGKSTVAREMEALLGRDPDLASVEVISTDSFLYPNDELEARGLSARKGFPESYDRSRLVATLAAVRAGTDEVPVPVYSHRDYDIVPGRHHLVRRPAALIVEGLNVLQVGDDVGRGDGGRDELAGYATTLVSDLLDWSIYIDAAEADIARWHSERLLGLRRSGIEDPAGFLGWFCSLSDEEARAVAEGAWSGINSVNLREHIAPTRLRLP